MKKYGLLIPYSLNEEQIYMKTWEEYQDFAIKKWHLDNRFALENNQKTLDDLIIFSEPLKVDTFSIEINLLFGIDLDITFNADSKKSAVWVAESVNYVPNILSFLESIILSNENEQFYFCEEEGPETYLYVCHIDKNIIRFIHLSQKVQFAEYIQTEDYKVRQDIIIDKEIFLRAFYTAIINAINNADEKEIKEEWGYQINEYNILKKGSNIIEKYLNNL